MTRLKWICAALAMTGTVALAQPAGTARTFVVDADASDVHWRVYKAGAFARFGHNHVISVAGLTGTVMLDGDGNASWELAFDVADLIVDDPVLRDAYGEDFSSEPSDEDIAGTKGNMLSETVLNGEQHASIRLTGDGHDGELDDATLSVVIEMLGRSIPLELPASIDISGETLTAEGEFSLQHADLGMEPFSVMMGALQVGPQIDFTYRVHAVAADR